MSVSGSNDGIFPLGGRKRTDIEEGFPMPSHKRQQRRSDTLLVRLINEWKQNLERVGAVLCQSVDGQNAIAWFDWFELVFWRLSKLELAALTILVSLGHRQWTDLSFCLGLSETFEEIKAEIQQAQFDPELPAASNQFLRTSVLKAITLSQLCELYSEPVSAFRQDSAEAFQQLGLPIALEATLRILSNLRTVLFIAHEFIRVGPENTDFSGARLRSVLLPEDNKGMHRFACSCGECSIFLATSFAGGHRCSACQCPASSHSRYHPLVAALRLQK